MIEGVKLISNVLRSDVYDQVWDFLSGLEYTRIERPAMHLFRCLQDDNTDNEQARYLTDLLKAHNLDRYIIFNDVSVVKYSAGADYVDWHSDGGPLLEPGCQMGILSLGASRRIEFRKKGQEEAEYVATLEANDLIVQREGFQGEYQHRIPAGDNDCLRFSIVLFTHNKSNHLWQRNQRPR